MWRRVVDLAFNCNVAHFMAATQLPLRRGYDVRWVANGGGKRSKS